MTICEKAHAKINLYLAVGQKRADGFHDICTYMRRISLADDLTCTFLPAEETHGCVATEGAAVDLPADEHNLAAQGAMAVLKAAGVTAQVTIRLVKRIPSAAGLGGGSSDAAAAMRAANRYLQGRYTDAQLQALAADIGSDVPFFITGQPAVCRGRGEILTPLAPAFEGWCVLVPGAEPSATGTAYAALDRARLTSGMETPPLPDFTCFLPRDIHNDFEAPVSALCPSVPRHLAMLRRAGAQTVAMSGSGSAVFGLFSTEKHAVQAATQLVGQGIYGAQVTRLL